MKHVTLPGGERVPALGLGTWRMGETAARRGQEAAILRQGLDRGLTLIDTAEMYGEGGAEEVVAEAIAGRRDDVFIVSKLYPHNASRDGVVAACDRSLARLATETIDLYLLHWRGTHPLSETVEGFERLKRDGKIRYWGVSNFDVPDLEEAWKTAGGSDIVCNQVLYHVQERAIEHAVLPWCEQHRLAVTAYSPFGHGDFPSKLTPGGRVLADIAQAHEATPRQIALAFLTRRPSVFAAPKASSVEHVEENAGASDIRLSQAQIARIDAAFPRGQPPRRLPMI